MVAVSLALVAGIAQSSPDIGAFSSGFSENETSGTAANEPASKLERITIRLASESGQPRWSIGERRFRNLKEVREIVVQLAAVEPSCAVVLDVAGEVSLGDSVELVDLCKGAGLGDVQFAIGPRDAADSDAAKDNDR
jgi:hypothetical protein